MSDYDYKRAAVLFGEMWEDEVAEMLGSKRTEHNVCYDLILPDGRTVEVKASQFLEFQPNRKR